MPQYKRYREELKGKAVPDLWDDVDRINPVGNDALGKGAWILPRGSPRSIRLTDRFAHYSGCHAAFFGFSQRPRMLAAASVVLHKRAVTNGDTLQADLAGDAAVEARDLSKHVIVVERRIASYS